MNMENQRQSASRETVDRHRKAAVGPRWEVQYRVAGEPWHVANLGHFDTFIEAGDASGDWLKGFQTTHDGPVEVRVRPVGDLDRLADAAPALLAALKRVQVWLMAPDTSPETLKEMCEQARAAIARAEVAR